MTWLEWFGVTPALIVTAIGTLFGFWLSARWSSAESRRQFQAKQDSEARAAASVLISSLLLYAETCDQRYSELSEFMASGGDAGSDAGPRDLTFPVPALANAAEISPEVAQGAIQIQRIEARASQAYRDLYEPDDYRESREAYLGFLSLLAARSRSLVDLASSQTRMKGRHSASRIKGLEARAIGHVPKIIEDEKNGWR